MPTLSSDRIDSMSESSFAISSTDRSGSEAPGPQRPGRRIPDRWVVALFAIIALGIALRSVNLTAPYLLDHHSFRQSETAAFAHGYLSDSFKPWDPTDSRYPCPQVGQRFGFVEAELPIYAWIAVVPLKVLGFTYPPAWYLRCFWLLFYAVGSVYLYALVRRLGDDRRIALLGVFAFSVFPASIFFTRAILPDGPSLTFGLAFLYYLATWLEQPRRRDELLLIGFGAAVLLTKISNAYLAFPAAFLILQRHSSLWQALGRPRYWVWLVAIGLLPALWYWHAHSAPWSFGVWGGPKDGKYTTWESLRKASLWMRFSQRLYLDVIGWAGIVLAVIGFTRFRQSRALGLAAAWLFGFFVFLLVAMRAHAVHVYYQLPLVVPFGIAAAHGIDVLWRGRLPGRIFLAAAAALHFVTTDFVLSETTRAKHYGYFKQSNRFTEAIELLRKHAPEGKYFVSFDTRPEIFYNSGRRGYMARNILTSQRCLEDGTRIIMSNKQRSKMRRHLKKRRKLARQLTELERTKRYSIWRYDSDRAAKATAAHSQK